MGEYRGPDSSDGISTSYALNGPATEYRWGRKFPQLSSTALGPTQPPVRCVTGLVAWDKAAGAWR